MTIVCIQCSLRALVDDQPTPIFEGSMEDHLREYHPDPVMTQFERMELERLLAEKLKQS